MLVRVSEEVTEFRIHTLVKALLLRSYTSYLCYKVYKSMVCITCIILTCFKFSNSCLSVHLQQLNILCRCRGNLIPNNRDFLMKTNGSQAF